MVAASNPNPRRLAAGILLVALLSTGCQATMPNTGLVRHEFTHLHRAAVEAEATAGVLGSGIVDSIAGQAFKIVARQLDARLEALQSRYQGAYGLVYPHEGSMDPDGSARRYRWTFVRGVRFAADRLDSLPLSDPLRNYLRRHAPEISPPNVACQSDTDCDHLKNGWYVDPDDHRYYQLVTTRLTWDTAASSDGSAFRIEQPRLEVFATEAELPRWDEVRKAIREQLPANDEVLGKIGALADDALVDALSIRLAVNIELSFPASDGRMVEVGRFGGAIRGIWPADTLLEGNRLVPALAVNLDAFDSLWLSNTGRNYNLKIDIGETSKVSEWIQEAREALSKQVEQRR